MQWAYSEFTLDAETLPSQLGGRNMSEDIANVASNIGTVDESHFGIARATEGDLTLVELPTPGPAAIG